MARILIGVSGGIAAYKSVELARLATLAGHGVRILMTPSARRFVGPATFEGIVGAPVLFDEFEADPARGTFPGDPAPQHAPISHLALSEAADAFVVAPASANTIAKLAAGICDSLLATSFLACAAPRILAPAMNDRMWSAEATRSNVALLRDRGVEVLDPDEGALASRGEHGRGRMQEPAAILAAIERSLGSTTASPDSMAGVRVLVTAGGTREAIDPVRFIGNRSSGRMGIALAEAAAARGAQVTLVAANVAQGTSAGVERIDVVSAEDLARATEKAFDRADVLLMAAAVADFRPEAGAAEKLVREGSDGLDVHLEPTADVLAGLSARRRPGQVLVGFAAEHGGDYVERARGKLERKGLDAIVVNDVSDPSIGFDSPDNEVTLVNREGANPLPRGSKEAVAESILDGLAHLQ
ncbi:MAG: bifunctional phosphopantothenoylcysteine decarboxylase/phosphopantothenate--cysteine ligase CoaBC [Solirubrobacterales bacterium]|nr:bifunctional phosphopantothenoylcysteine decarboxylase/phosphopantothenate--cysteine ligase CoaBC [Solirubrobacterales bacterium]